MTNVLFQRCDGKPAGDPIALPRGRRRLSSIVRRHADRSRPHIVSVHRKKHPLAVSDMSVRLRSDWRKTSIGPHDTVIIVYLPRGGASATGGNSRAGKGASIGIIVATVALAAIGQFWAVGALAGALGTSTAVAGAIWGVGSAALLAGAGYLLSRATQAKANNDADANRPVYGVSGGGNRPRSGDRIPVIYGRCWTTPDLSQPDYTVYDGDDQVLYKRLTVGCGKYAFKSIRVSNAVMWTSDGGLTPPFATAQVEFIAPGGGSGLVPGQVATASAVSGNEVRRATEFPAYTGPFDFGAGAPQQSRIQLDFTLPGGCYSVPDGGKFQGKQFHATWGVRFEYAPCDEDGHPTGGWQVLHEASGYDLTTSPMRFTRFADIAPGRYTFRAQNFGDPAIAPGPGFNANVTNSVIWEGLRAHIPQAAVRPGITELALKIRSGKDLGVTSYGEVEVEVQRILPVWNGAGWAEEETSKSVWAKADILRDPLHGAALPDSALDLDRLRHYATTLTKFDRFSGVIRGPISVYEALTTVLGTMRASPLRLGNAWTLVRDEPKAVRKHVITRRQILKDSTQETFTLDVSDGSSDIIVEWLSGGDPRRRREHRVTFGPQTLTPRRMQATGADDAEHAIHLATWAAASTYFRRSRRGVALKLAGRLLLPNDKVMIDNWFLDPLVAVGVQHRDGLTLTVDKDDLDLLRGSYAVLRARDGKEWGPVGITQSGNRLTLDADDVAQAQSMSGLTLAQVLNTRTQAATSVVIGTLTEVQDSWLIRSVQFSGSNVNVEAVYDAQQVWSALAEPIVIPPPPPSSGLENVATVTVAYVQPKAVQRNGAMYMDWTVGRARDAATYVVEISYDNWVTSELAYRGPSSNGKHPLREFTGVIYVRAYGISASGLRGQFVFNQFSVVPAIIDLGNAGAGTLPYKAFLAGMEPVGLVVNDLPELFGYEGPKIVMKLDTSTQKRTMHQLSDDGTKWDPLAAEDYVANSIKAGAISAGAVKATAIDVEYLSAISANLGAITAGSLNINNRFLVAADGTMISQSSPSGQRTIIDSNGGRVYDSSGQLRVRWGTW